MRTRKKLLRSCSSCHAGLPIVVFRSVSTQGPLLILSTFVATLNQASPARQFYLSSETEHLLGKVLTTFMDGDREIMRAFCCALSIEFAKLFPFGMLLKVLSYGHDRLIRFEHEQGQLTRLGIYKHSTNKEIVSLGVETAYLMSDAVAHFQLPTLPFSYQQFPYRQTL